MITVHHLGISQSDRIVWLCEEMSLPYELKHYERDPVTRLAPASYKALTPFGTAPVITDGDLVLGESAAIIEYLLATYGNARFTIRPGAPGFADYLFWFHFANGSLMPAAMIGMVAGAMGASSDVEAALGSRLEKAYDAIEARLGTVPYLAGDEFTAADILTVFPLTTMRLFGPRDLSPYPNIKAYLQRIAARPAFQQAMAKADPGLKVPLD